MSKVQIAGLGLALVLVTTTVLVYRDYPYEEMTHSLQPVEIRQFIPSDIDQAKLLNLISTLYLKRPSSKPYNLKGIGNDKLMPSQGQAQAVMEVMANMRGGFFIECGALDGETRSNTLVLEQELGWKGLLVEAGPRNYDTLLTKHRKAWSVQACLSTVPYPNTVLFQQEFNIGQIVSADSSGKRKANQVEVQCLTVYSLMLALNRTTIDYFSLDVEGVELEVLQTIPWDKVNIKMLSVEYAHGPKGKEFLRSYMERLGYWVYKEISKNVWADDYFFIHKSYKTPDDFKKHNLV